MKKTLIKLSAAAVLVVIALVIVVVSTFAWYTVSGTPEVGGIQLNIGVGGTLQIAADLTAVTSDGVVHYPGTFSDSLNFSRYETYEYLQDVVTLTPVSTADGIHWFFPTDGQTTGKNILDGYLMDDTYSYANLSELPADDSVHGNYVMLDFWVMAPMDCSLRVSYGDTDSGTYAVSLPYPVKEGESCTLGDADEMLPACVRVGFLADTRTQTDGSMRAYMDSNYFDEKVHSLKGVYGTSGQTWDGVSPQFSLYEPNADVHGGDNIYSETPDGSVYRECADGSYVKTYPIGYVDGQAKPVDITDRTAVQTATHWLQEGDSLLIQQLFETYMLGQSTETDEKTLFSKFCSEYLGYQCDAYIEKGAFIKETASIDAACQNDGTVSATDFDSLLTAGAADDVVIVDLERNVPQRIRMFVWVEGQDVDCSSVIAASGLMIRLELAGSSH